jgi:ribosomal protein S18 acetylase RimI-like enzyme
MEKINIRNYVPEDISQVIEVQKEYKRKYPNYSIRGAEVYTHHPVFENGKNILCAFDNKDRLIAYSPIVAAPVNDDSPEEYPHYLWTDIIFNPTAETLGIAMDLLLEKVRERAVEIKATFPKRKTRLASLKFSEEIEGIDWYISKGFENYDTVYTMIRDLSKPIEEVSLPDEIEIRRWRISTEEEKLKYLNAENISNPNKPISMEELEWSLGGTWSVGSAIGAFDRRGNLIGSVMAYWFNDVDGITEEIFVLPQWRRKSIAQGVIREALVYLKECGKLNAELEVKKSNGKAITLYEKMGYEIDKEERSLGIFI